MDRFGLALLPNDKDPGFSLMHRSVLEDLHSEMLQNNVYNEVSPMVLDRVIFCKSTVCCACAFHVSKATDR